MKGGQWGYCRAQGCQEWVKGNEGNGHSSHHLPPGALDTLGYWWQPHLRPCCLSPPPIVIGAGTERCIQDVAVIEVDASKINPSNFVGNIIVLGTKFSHHVLTSMMYLKWKKNLHIFYYLGNCLLSLQGTIPDEEMRNSKNVWPFQQPLHHSHQVWQVLISNLSALSNSKWT